MPEETTILIVTDRNTEAKYNFANELQYLPVSISTLYSPQVDNLERHFANYKITKVILINMALRYDNVRDFLIEHGQPVLIEFTMDESARGLETFVPRWEETNYPRTYYKASAITISNFLKNEEQETMRSKKQR